MSNPNSAVRSDSDSEDSALVSRNNNQMNSRKRKTKTEVRFLPEEIIIKILLFFPAKVLYGVMSTICRSWYKLIRNPTFIKAHRSCSTTSPFCFLIYDWYFRIYSLKNDKITWTYKRTINQVYLTHGNGFILARKGSSFRDPLILNLVNPFTEQIILLPRLSNSSREDKYTVSSCSRSTQKYKVLVFKSRALYILTVGDDKEWREINLSRHTSSWLHPVVGHQGLIYCYRELLCNNIIAFDVEMEVFQRVSIPKQVPNHMWEMCSGTNLVMNYGTSDCREFWELVDYKNGGEWQRFGVVDIESKKQEIFEILGESDSFYFRSDKLKPVVVLSKDVMIFKSNTYFLAYNFKMEKFSRCFDGFRQSFQCELMVDNSLEVL